MRSVDCAFQIVESDGSRIVLLGTEPHEPDPEYGYIVPGETIDSVGLDRLEKFEMFVEKPSTQGAQKIIRSRGVVTARKATALRRHAGRLPKLGGSPEA